MPKTRKKKHYFSVVIMPGRFDRKAEKVVPAREKYAKRGSICLGTEGGAIPFHVLGFTVEQGEGAKGETFVASKDSMFAVREKHHYKITSGDGTGRFANPTYAAVEVLVHHDTNKVVIPISAHLRAHLWPGSQHYQPGNIKSWWEGVRNLRTLVNHLLSKYPGAIIIIGGDPNAAHKRFFYKAVAKVFKNFSIAWGNAFASLWLHGAKVVHIEQVDSEGASDHPWYIMTVAFRD